MESSNDIEDSGVGRYYRPVINIDYVLRAVLENEWIRDNDSIIAELNIWRNVFRPVVNVSVIVRL